MKGKYWLFVLLLPLISLAQEKEKSKIKLELSGFVKADYVFDSRQNVEAREGFYIAYPKPIVKDANGIDINGHPSANQYAMTTRLGVKAIGPEILNAKSMAYIESDFTGPSNSTNNAFRLRHAYIRLDWKNTSFLMGQYWHPFDVPEMLPLVLSLNTGAPMHAFSRGPQMRLTQNTGPIKWVAVAYAQRDYASNGPNGVSNEYLRNGLIPDLSLQAHYAHRNIFAGIGASYKQLHFRSFTLDNKLLSDNISSLSALAFIKFESKKWDIRLQTIWGENLYDHLMLGGVAVSEVDSINAKILYTNLSAASAWGTVYYKFEKLKIGVFGGYISTLGSTNEITGPVYARGFDMKYVYRISPQWSYKIKNLIIANEWEYTVAAYGNPDSYGKVKDAYTIGNLRFTLSLIYII
jgi:hypothetical protein